MFKLLPTNVLLPAIFFLVAMIQSWASSGVCFLINKLMLPLLDFKMNVSWVIQRLSHFMIVNFRSSFIYHHHIGF